MERQRETPTHDQLKERARKFWEAGPTDFDLEAIETRVRGSQQIGPYETAIRMINQEYAPGIVRDYTKFRNLPTGRAWHILQEACGYYGTRFAEGYLPTPGGLDQLTMARQYADLAEGFGKLIEEMGLDIPAKPH